MLSALGVAAHVVVAVSAAFGIGALGGALASRLGQPRVIGEIALGLSAGPLLLAGLGGDRFHAVLPSYVIDCTRFVGHVGLVLFLIGVAHELGARPLSGRAATGVTAGSLVVPLLIGALLGGWVTWSGDPALRGGAPAVALILLLAVSLAVTAVPVLARIMAERGIAGQRIGRLAMSSAIFVDAVNWPILALAIGLAAGGPLGAVVVVGLMVAGVIAALVLRRLLGSATRLPERAPRFAFLLLAVAGLAASALLQDLGLTEIFGALLVGLAVPADGPWTRVVDVAAAVGARLVPVFFVATGLLVFTNIHLDTVPWLVIGVAIAAGTVGKIGGTYLGARMGGESPGDCLRLGVLMNTRGLTELIVLQAGLRAGVLTPLLFLALVVMALVTTAMTGPLYALLDRRTVATVS